MDTSQTSSTQPVSREVVEDRSDAVVADKTIDREKNMDNRYNSPHRSSSGYRYTAPSSDALGDFLIQRAIQQQLYYHAQLGNEPMANWLKSF